MRALLVPIVLVACGASRPSRHAVFYNTRAARSLAALDLDAAEAGYRLALEYDPKLSEAHAGLGVVALRRLNLREAETHLRAAVLLNEDFALAWSNLGVVLEGLEHPSQARKAYEAALRIDPGVVLARRNLAFLLIEQGKFAPARAHLMRLRVIVPSDPEIVAALAYAEFLLHRPSAARERAETALRTLRDQEPCRARSSASPPCPRAAILPRSR